MKYYNGRKTRNTLKKRIALVGLASAITITGAAFFLRPEPKEEPPVEEHAITGIVYSEEKDEADTDFVLVDSASPEILEQVSREQKNMGLVVDMTMNSYLEVYKKVDEVKKIVRKYEITYPICLNLDPYVEERENFRSYWWLNSLVREFVQKLEANNCYVCVMGKEEVLNSLINYRYHKVLVREQDTDVDTSQYCMVVSDGQVDLLCQNIAGMIVSQEMNRADRFVDDFSYQIQEGDTLWRLQVLFGMQMDDLSDYNGIANPDMLSIGERVTIPSIYGDMVNYYYSGVNHELMDREDLEKDYALGIVVEYSGYDYSNLDSSIQFAMIKSSHGKAVSPAFLKNLETFRSKGLAIGIQHYSSARTAQEINKEIAVLLPTLEEAGSVELPVYLDTESSLLLDHEGIRNDLINGTDEDRERINQMFRTFCEKITAAGYTAGIRLHKDAYPYLDQDLKKGYAIWLVGGEFNNEYLHFDNLKLGYKENSNVTNYQITDFCLGNSIGMGDGNEPYMTVTAMDKEYFNQLVDQPKVKEYQKNE